MPSLASSLQEKEYEPERILIVSIEESRTQGESFWNSIPVKSTLPKNSILYRIILDENADEYEQFNMKYSVPKTFSLYIFGSNSMIISKMWTEGFPDPADFAAYMGGLQAGAFEYDEPHEAQYDAEAEIPENPEESNQRVKKVKISIRNEDGMQSHMFNETDTVEQLQQWLTLVVGRGHRYSIAHNNEMLTEDNSMTLKDAGLSPSALLRIQDNTGPMGQAPRRGDGAVNRAEAGNCWTRFVRRILLVLSFINPFASEGDQESFWEYQPSNNPDIAQVIAQNIMA